MATLADDEFEDQIPEDSKKKIYDYLSKKYNSDDPAAALLRNRNPISRPDESYHPGGSFFDALAKASASAGSIGGHVADTSVLDKQTAYQEADEAQRTKEETQMLKDKAEINRYLFAKYLQSQKPEKPEKPEMKTYYDSEGNERAGKWQGGQFIQTATDPIVKPKGLKADDPLTAYQRVKVDEHKQDQLDNKVLKFGETLNGPRELMRSISDVETLIGFPLESYDEKTKKVAGKNVDLPGVSLPGLGRITSYSDEARQLQGAAQKIFNVEIRDRSGTAVTNNEMDRLKQEFAAGRMNTEEDLLQGMKRYKMALQDELRNREAGFSPDVKKEYQNRGGQTLADYQQNQVPVSNKYLVPQRETANAKPGAKSYEDMSDSEIEALYRKKIGK